MSRAAKKTPRAQLIREFVASRGKAGATLSEIIEGCVPRAERRQQTAAERARVGRIYAAQSCDLVEKNKLARSGQPQGYRYFATTTTLIDARKRTAGTTAPRPCKRKPRQAKPAPVPKAIAAPAAPKPAEPKPQPHRVVVKPTAKNSGIKGARTVDSDRIAADVAAFLRAGGRIEKLSHGASSQPLRMTAHEHNAASMRRRLREQGDGIAA